MSKLQKCLWVALGVAVLMCSLTPVLAEDAVTAQRDAQRKLLAQRAARADAMRKLAERIKGLRITSSTTVQDFVTEDDTIDTALRAWLLGMKEEGKYKHNNDGTCEITMSVTLLTVEDELTRLHKAYYKGKKYKIKDIQSMRRINKLSKITETGMGAMPEELDENPLSPTDASGRNPAKVPDYWTKHCTGQGRLMAVKAARVDAMRRLAERIKGTRITSDTTVQDFVTESDDINMDMRAFLKGAKEVGVRYHRKELIVEVEMEVTLKTVVATVRRLVNERYKGKKQKLKYIDEYIEKVRYDKIVETGMGVPPKRFLKGYTEVQIAVLTTAAAAPPWATDTLRAKGQAAVDTENPNQAQAKLMAYRAAELDARRKLAEELNGLMIRSDTSVKDFVAQDDTIDTRMTAFQLGAKVVKNSQKLNADGTAEVTVEIELKPLWNIILYGQKRGLRLK
ncbi:MAG: hypothetical protein KAR11_02000 [Phycisphaerae bacterium]|nr:hypothetical protein [Phycisphaerae bacterium]